MSHEITEILEFCCHSKDNGKIKKNPKILSPRKMELPPELAFFNSPQSGISWHLFIAQCGVLQAVLLQRGPGT